MKLILTSLLLLFPILSSQAADPIPVIIDTDIGSDIDDTFALALAFASPELDVKAITTCGGAADDRAWLVCRFLTQTGTKAIPVAAGKWENKPPYDLDWQIQYRRHPAAIFNRTVKPVKESAVELLYSKLKEKPGELTLICVGPLTNIAQLLKEHPDAKPMIKRLAIMGGSIKIGYDGKKQPEPE
ncbi:MAG: nucleoside hydrolase, partial [Planctomycetes bacterium]|nr:nucleoside hydrolase [Planctomycetota bacterium]